MAPVNGPGVAAGFGVAAATFPPILAFLLGVVGRVATGSLAPPLDCFLGVSPLPLILPFTASAYDARDDDEGDVVEDEDEDDANDAVDADDHDITDDDEDDDDVESSRSRTSLPRLRLRPRSPRPESSRRDLPLP